MYLGALVKRNWGTLKIFGRSCSATNEISNNRQQSGDALRKTEAKQISLDGD